MRIDLALLTRLDACAVPRAAFAAAFPDGLDVVGEPNADAIARVVAAKIDVDWLCERVLTPTALDAYDEATAPALAAYYTAIAAARDAYREATAPARYAYDEAIAAARDAYREATAPARDAYDAATATAAWTLLANPDNIRQEFI